MKTLKIIIITLIFFATPAKINAADYTITCNQKTCTTNDVLIFNQSNLAPGDIISKTIKVKNTSSKNLDITLNPSSTSSANLQEKIDINLTNFGSSTYFNNTLKLFLDSSINLKNIGGKSFREFNLTASIQRVDNTYQGKNIEFDLKFNFSQPEESSSSSTSNNQTEAIIIPKTNQLAYQSPAFAKPSEVLGQSTPPTSPQTPFQKKLKSYLRWWPWLLPLLFFLLLYKRRRVR